MSHPLPCGTVKITEAHEIVTVHRFIYDAAHSEGEPRRTPNRALGIWARCVLPSICAGFGDRRSQLIIRLAQKHAWGNCTHTLLANSRSDLLVCVSRRRMRAFSGYSANPEG